MTLKLGDEHPQQVVDRASPGARIRADPAVTHNLTAPLLVDTAGLTIQGISLRLADGAATNLVEITADGVQFEDFRIDGNASGAADDFRSTGVAVTGAENVTIADGRINDTVRHGVLVADPAGSTSTVPDEDLVTDDWGPARHVTVRNVRVDAPNRDGCSVEGVGVDHVQVSNVRTTDSRDRGNVEVKDGASSAVVTGCHATDCNYSVAVEDHGQYPMSDVVIAGNSANACAKLINANTAPDIDHENVIATGNAGRDITGEPLARAPDGAICLGNVEGLVVANNAVRGAAETGIHVYGTADAQVVGNRAASVTDGPGIALTDAPGAIVLGNVVRDVSGAGIAYENLDGTSQGDVQISHNRCAAVDGAGVAFRLERRHVAHDRLAEAMAVNVPPHDPGTGTVDNYLVTENSLRGAARGIDDTAAGPNGVVTNNLY